MRHPLVYEINTRCWLREMSARAPAPLTLAEVPDEVFDHWRALGFSHLWLMGVWTSGPRSRALALATPELHAAYREALPDWRDEDVAGSPYAVAAYEVAPELGGERALKQFRKHLHRRGLKLILDFVPNHLGLDHPWLARHPDYFVQSPMHQPGTFAVPTKRETRYVANGRDPYFPPWTDTAQLDYRRADTRRAMLSELKSVAALCDGVRCDMAMLLLNDIFASTWAAFPGGPAPEAEFWAEAIPAVKRRHPEFLFLAEAYWNTSSRLRAQGFDFVYDKAFYDRLVERNAPSLQSHLLDTPPAEITGCAHFLENHDEPRAASWLGVEEHRPAALLVLGLPGLRLLHEGQLTGARQRVPVQLARRPEEPVDERVHELYDEILTALRQNAVGRGEFALLRPREAWPGNATHQNLLLIQWQSHPDEFDLVVVNLAAHRAQGYAPLTVARLAEFDWRLHDLLGSEVWDRVGADLVEQGLYLDVAPHAAQLFRFTPFQ